MSAPLLRQATFNPKICSALLVFRPRRFYAQTTLAYAPVVHSQSHEQNDSAAVEKPLGRNSADSKKRRPKDSAPLMDPLAATGLELYLQAIRDSCPDPKLSDIERCRPERHADDVDSEQYAEEYNALVNRLCRSFSRQQLREFTILFNINSRSTWFKHQFAEAIIERQWKWPSLKEVQKQHRDRTEISVKTFPVNPMQLFLLLGKDGAELLQMSKEYNVHIAVTRSPLALRVEGLRASLDALSEYITAVKNAIVEETFKLPGGMPIKQDLVQPISRLADAYVENLRDEGMVRICAKLRRNLDLAKRLVTRASFESAESSRMTLLSYLPTGVAISSTAPRVLFPHTYSVFPFLSPRSLPWTMKSGGAFRIRRVIEWLGAQSHEDIQATGGLAGGKGRILSIDEKELDLMDTLFGELPERNDAASSRIVTASFGHVLLPSATSSQRASIVPPFKGFWPFAKILTWMETTRTETTFVPSLPMQCLNSTPNQQKILVRFFYHALSESSGLSEGQRHLSRSQPTKMIRFEVVLAHSRPAQAVTPSEPLLDLQPQLQRHTEPESQPVEDEIASSREVTEESQGGMSATQNQHLFSSEVQKFVQSVLPNKEYGVSNDTSGSVTTECPEEVSFSTAIGPEFSTQPRCWVGVETTANLILPDRPMDIHFSAFDHIALPRDQEPEELQSYSSALQSFLQGQDVEGKELRAPIPPNTFMHNGEAYVLHRSASIRQSSEAIPGFTVDDSNPETLVRVVNESILDLESQQKSTVCEVSCVDHASADGWKAFLGDCDRLTSALYSSVGDEGADAKSLGLDID